MKDDVVRRRGDYFERWSHINPKYLIEASEHYIVFIGDDLLLDWETSQEYDKIEGLSNGEKHNAIKAGVARLEAIPTHGLEENVVIQYRRLLGEALVYSFCYDYKTAKATLIEADKYITDRRQEASRYWYLCSSLVTTLVFLIIGLLLWTFRSQFEIILGFSCLLVILSYVSGTCGAALSVITRTGKLTLDSSAGAKLHYLEGASRILAGGFSGLLASLAVKTGIILSMYNATSKLNDMMILTAFAAGAAERLAPSIVSQISAQKPKIENEENSGHKDKKSD